MMKLPDNVTELYKRNNSAGKYVLYWMQQSQRVQDNPALNYALAEANQRQLPLVVLFVITNEFPAANLRHYTFMLEGIYETMQSFSALHIHLIVTVGSMVKAVTSCSAQATLVVTDRGYLRIQRAWRAEIAAQLDCSLLEVEGDVLFPVEQVMTSEAYNARSIRSRIYKLLPEFSFQTAETPAVQYTVSEPLKDSLRKLMTAFPNFTAEDMHDLNHFIEKVKTHLNGLDSTVLPVNSIRGSYSEAVNKVTCFTDYLLDNFYEQRSNPGQDYQSGLSPYLHFGQISTRDILSKVINALGISDEEFTRLILNVKPGSYSDSKINGALVLFEQAVIRRELSMNFCWFNPDYDKFSSLPDWAQATLEAHTADKRNWLYSLALLEQAQTHDVYWNAAQKEMCLTGKMHGYMRMYWGKKLIEWMLHPTEAFQTALYLNNKYEIDGRDPNGFAGIAWCFGKHDRPWTSFPILGNVRTMTAKGLQRKFDMQAYLERIEKL
jgi:deoxyribodipyrimidine photo-lyase